MKRLDRKDTRYYKRAAEVFPDLVRKETPIVSFLRVERYDPTKAALRLANYWRFRKDLFGDRWLLPMTQTGTGCLSMPDIELLRTGYRHFISRTDDGPLLIVDYGRSGGKYDSKINCRLLMYGATVMSEQLMQTEGVSVMHVINQTTAQGVIDLNRESYAMIKTALPLKPKRTFVVRAYVEGKEGIMNYLAYQAARVATFRTGIHYEQLIADSAQGTLALVKSRGCHRKHVPACLGGDWDYSEFDEWIRRRISVEDIMSAAPVISNKLLAPVVPHSTRQKALLAKAGNHHFHDKNNTTTTQKHKTKKASRGGGGGCPANPVEMNRLYARRCYHKKKLEVLGLQEEVDAMHQSNEVLRQEQARLEQLLEAAMSVVGSLGLPYHQGVGEANNNPVQQNPTVRVPLAWNDFRSRQYTLADLNQLQQL